MLSKKNQRRIKCCNICGEQHNIIVKTNKINDLKYGAEVKCLRCSSASGVLVEDNRDLATTKAIKKFKSLHTTDMPITILDIAKGITYFSDYEEIINALNMGLTIEQNSGLKFRAGESNKFSHTIETITLLEKVGIKLGEVFTNEEFNKYGLL